MPNLYFTRDPFATIGAGVSIHRMHTATRNRETLFGKFIFEYHPEYKNVPRWYDRGETSSLEGGDILILSPEVLAVGISQRTREDSIDQLAETVLTRSSTFRKVLAFNIPKSRSFMHLDTVFTMVDRDKFTVHPNILQQMTVFVMELDENRKMKIHQEDGRLEDILKELLHLDQVTLIPCGQGSEIDAAREQWSDGSNTLAIAPGEVVVYSRNYVTNRSLEEAGVKLHVIPSLPNPAALAAHQIEKENHHGSEFKRQKFFDPSGLYPVGDPVSAGSGARSEGQAPGGHLRAHAEGQAHCAAV